MQNKLNYKAQRVAQLENVKQNYASKKKRSEQSSINVDLEHKAKRLFDKLNLKFDKIPTLNHDEGLAEGIEGQYGQEKLSVRKNPRVSDKKAESVVMHEIYHHIQKDKGLSLEEEEAEANMVEEAYLNENQEANEAPDFDLIYAHTIKKFYEMHELERLVNIFGGDGQSARNLYANAMQIISENS
jgi:hypothetical protein